MMFFVLVIVPTYLLFFWARKRITIHLTIATVGAAAVRKRSTIWQEVNSLPVLSNHIVRADVKRSTSLAIAIRTNLIACIFFSDRANAMQYGDGVRAINCLLVCVCALFLAYLSRQILKSSNFGTLPLDHGER